MLPRRSFLGASVHDTDCGVEIRKVWPASMAERAGARPGDRILAFGHRVETVADVARACRERAREPSTVVRFERDGRELRERVARVPYPAERVEGGVVRYGAHGGLRTILVEPEDGADTVIFFLPGIAYASVDFALREAQPTARILSALVAAGVATFRLERPGLGDSPGEPCVGFEDEHALYREALDALGRFDRVVLFGHSVGGIHAALLADRADAVAVYGTTARRWSTCLKESVARQRAARGLPHSDTAFAWPSDRSVRFHEELEALDLARAWAGIDVPTLVLAGEYDWVVGDADHAATGRAVEVIAGLDHAFTTHPALDVSLRNHGRGEPGLELAARVASFALSGARR